MQDPKTPKASDSGGAPRRVSERVLQHLPLVVTAGFGVLTGALLMRVSVGNTQTALAVLQQGGTGNVLLGSALSMVPLVVAGTVGGLLAHIWRAPDQRRTRRERVSKVLWSVGVVAVGLLLAPPALVCISALMSLWLRAKSDETQDSRGGMAFFVLAIAWLLVAAKPWWPLERVEPAEGEAITGYVLSASGTDLAMLESDPRRVVHLSMTDSHDRRICTEDSTAAGRWFGESLWSMISGPPAYGSCER